MTGRLVLYHASCTDGFTAAWAVLKAHPDSELIPVTHGTAPPDVTGRHVVIVDFSYKRPVLMEMLGKASFIEIYDHHASAQKDLQDLVHDRLEVVFDMKRSGAGIAWDEFHPSTPRPWLVNVVEDVDLWNWKVPLSKELIEGIRSYPLTLQRWDSYCSTKLHSDFYIELVNEGEAILRAKKQNVEMSCKFAQEVEFDGHKVFASNVPYFLSSEVGNALIRDRPFGMTYFQREDGKWILSFRSDSRQDFDVSALAVKYGGGGHKYASGAQIDNLPWVLFPSL